MMVSRQDFHPSFGYGVSAQLMMYGDYDPQIRVAMCNALSARREVHGDGVVCVNVGANIGAFTIPWGLHMAGWGRVIAYEPQWFAYQLLVGNVMLNNVHRYVRPMLAAVGMECGTIAVPDFDYDELGSVASVELKPYTEGDTGQTLDYSKGTEVPLVTVDSLNLERLDLLFCDAEGMDAEVLKGARETLSRCHPIVVAEHAKCGWPKVEKILGDDLGYKMTKQRMDVLAIHPDDPTSELVRTE